MTLYTWLAYVGIVIVATSSPGPAVFYVITNSTMYGKKNAVYAALGNITGLLILGLITIAGLGTILSTSKLFFDIVKYIGAAYLIYLGVKMFLQKDFQFKNSFDDHCESKKLSLRVYCKAIGVALSNPKAIVLLTALFPQFINTSYNVTSQFFILLFTLMFFSFSLLVVYGLLASKAGNWLSKPVRSKVFVKTGGSIFVVFGVLLAISSK